jgi:hypothetical protein
MAEESNTFSIAQIQAELAHLEINLQNAMQHLEAIKAAVQPHTVEVPTTKNVAGFVPGDRVEVTWDHGLRFHIFGTGKGRLGL